MIKIAIVDDSTDSIDVLKEYILSYEKDKGVECKIRTYSNAIDFVTDYKCEFDIIFMDINMPHLNGMEAAKKIREVDSSTCLIFITSHAKYAITGYEVQALDFIIKPVDKIAFLMKMDKAVRHVSKYNNKSYLLKNPNGIMVLEHSEIYYVESRLHYVYFHTNSDVYSKREKLDVVEKELNNPRFCRCGASYLVNLDYVTKVDGNQVTVGNYSLPISRASKAEFLDALTRHLGGGVI